MPVGFSAAAANSHLDAQVAAYPWIRLHVGDPGASGTAFPAVEATRKQPAWSAASGAAKTTSADVVWTAVGAAEDYTHFSMWSASTGGAFGGSGTISANALLIGDTFSIPAGELTLTLPVAS